ncbi:MAG: hypothetical protein EOO61_11995 [Hymenobacter sp.]|nr:MAG: hypothetical protein EOO61_11995 [Hymenobacter sp.]
MLKVTNKEILTPTGLTECWFFYERVDSRRKIESLIRLFCEDIITGMEVGEKCVYFIKGKNFVKLLKSESSGWELETLSPEDSKAFLDLEWVINLD